MSWTHILFATRFVRHFAVINNPFRSFYFDGFTFARPQAQDKVQQNAYDAEQRDIAEIKEFIARFGHGTVKMVRQAQSREKLLQKKLEDGLTEMVRIFIWLWCGIKSKGANLPPTLFPRLAARTEPRLRLELPRRRQASYARPRDRVSLLQVPRRGGSLHQRRFRNRPTEPNLLSRAQRSRQDHAREAPLRRTFADQGAGQEE